MLLHPSAYGQSHSNLALKNIQKQKWQRAYDLLTKALTKDSLNVTAKFVLAQYFFSQQNPDFQLDSAYHHVLEALKDFQQTTAQQRARLKRFPVDSLILVRLSGKIDSVAFKRAKSLGTENAFSYFILGFPHSSRINEAVELRDSTAYANAVEENTYQAFQKFLRKYPKAKSVIRAKEKYEILLFKDKTSDQSLHSYETFLTDYPNTPFRSIVEQTIFEYKTASGEIESFIAFVKDYPGSLSVKKAKNILFHLIPESERTVKWPKNFSNDSIAMVVNSARGYLAPFLRNGKFGFMNNAGEEVIPAQADSIDQAYLCGDIVEDVITLPGKIVSNTGSLIWKEKINSFAEIGVGFLIVEGEHCNYLIHKTGFQIGKECLDDAKILNRRFVALQYAKRWSIWTLSGRLLIKDLDDVFCIKDVIVLKRKAKFKLLTVRELSALPAPSSRDHKNEFDEVLPWGNNLIFVRNANYTGLMDQSLNMHVALGDNVLSPAFFGVSATSSSGTFLYNKDGQKSDIVQHFIAQDPWVAVKIDSIWRLYNPIQKAYSSSAYDSITFSGPFAVGHRNDSIRIFFSEYNDQQWSQPVTIEFIPGQDSSAFLMVQKGRDKSIYNHIGQRLFTGSFDNIQHAGCGMFIVHNKEKKGLVTEAGKLLLPIEYDAIGTVNSGLISLLKTMNFGLFDCVKKKLIKPAYRKNITLYNSDKLTAYKDGLYGFIGWDNRPLSKFEFSDIHYWSDSAALVKKDSQWMIYEIKTQKVLLDDIKNFRFIRNTPKEKLAIINHHLSYGVIHNHKGVIIPISFSDIINVGSEEQPLYFAEKHVKEASVFIVIYYNDQGQLLRKEIYDQEAYDKIYCHN